MRLYDAICHYLEAKAQLSRANARWRERETIGRFD